MVTHCPLYQSKWRNSDANISSPSGFSKEVDTGSDGEEGPGQPGIGWNNSPLYLFKRFYLFLEEGEEGEREGEKHR